MFESAVEPAAFACMSVFADGKITFPSLLWCVCVESFHLWNTVEGEKEKSESLIDVQRHTLGT